MDESQGNSDKMQPRCVDDTFAQFTSFGTAYLRAIESMRSDRIVNDPFAGRLTRQKRVDLEKFFLTTSKPSSLWGDFIAIRTRYLDEALEYRDGNIRQIVILGAGLDTRAFRLDSLHGCHIFEIDQSDQAFERMDQVMKEENVPLIAKKADYIVANLADDDWDSKLLAHGFDPSSPTFWIMEGLLQYMKRSCILTLLDALDGMSAPCSEFWADMVGEATFNFGDTAVTMKYSDDDPLHGVLSKIPWCLRLQASLKNGGIHFGRKWTPLISQDTNKTVSITFIMGKKPVSSEARLKDKFWESTPIAFYRRSLQLLLDVDDAFAESMGFVTTYLRALESARNDRLINDPFAEPLTRKQQSKIEKFLKETWSEVCSFPETLIAFRTRYLDEALQHRDPGILQIVILGAGLDARAYRMDALRGCHVLEVDQSGAVFEHKADVMKELHAPLIAQNVDCIISNLSEAGLEVNLMGHGFNPTMPTFWVMEGLIPYMERSSIVELLKIIDYLSAPGSQFWADIPGQTLVDSEEWGKRAMKYGEDDPLHGVFSEISWTLEVQASLKTAGEHFGRHWSPVLSPKNKQAVPLFFVVGKKPIPDVVVAQKMVPGLQFEE